MSAEIQSNHGVKTLAAQDVLNEMSEWAHAQVQDYRTNSNLTRRKINQLNSSLPSRSWRVVEDQVYHVQQDSLRLVQDLQQAGLETSRDIMTKHDTWKYVDDRGDPSVEMTPEVATEEGALTWQDDGTPIPVIYDSFSLGFREGPSPETEETPGEVSNGLDTLAVTTTTRRVNERIERLFLEGWEETIEFDGDGYTLYGMLSHPNTNTATFSEDWTDTKEGSDGTVLRDDVRRARRILKQDNRFRPGDTGYWVYMGEELYDSLDQSDPEGDGNTDIRPRIENLSNIANVRELEFLDDDAMLMFRPTEDVVDVGNAANVQPVMWEDPFRDNWVVMGSLYPRVKTTLTGQSGIVYMTP